MKPTTLSIDTKTKIDSSEVCSCSTPLDMARIWLTNLWHWRTGWAVRYLSKQLQRDPAFRESWYANIKMPIFDEMCAEVGHSQIGKQNVELAGRMADRLMKHLFNA